MLKTPPITFLSFGLDFNRELKNKNQAVRQGARRYVKRSTFKLYASIGENRVTLNGSLERSFSNSLLNRVRGVENSSRPRRRCIQEFQRKPARGFE